MVINSPSDVSHSAWGYGNRWWPRRHGVGDSTTASLRHERALRCARGVAQHNVHRTGAAETPGFSHGEEAALPLSSSIRSVSACLWQKGALSRGEPPAACRTLATASGKRLAPPGAGGRVGACGPWTGRTAPPQTVTRPPDAHPGGDRRQVALPEGAAALCSAGAAPRCSHGVVDLPSPRRRPAPAGTGRLPKG